MRIITALILSTVAFTCLAGQAAVKSVRMWPAPDRTRIVFDVNGPLEHTLFVLNNPARVVVDLRDTALKSDIDRPKESGKLLRRIRYAQRNHRDLRVVFDLRKPVRPRSFLLKPNKKYGYRLVVDLYDKGDAKQSLKESIKRAAPRDPSKLRNLIIAIDAGHGGEDPGTIGRKGTREKDVVLAIAKELSRQVKNEHGMRPVLVRRGDYYIGLRRRMKIAREQRARSVRLHPCGLVQGSAGAGLVGVRVVAQRRQQRSIPLARRAGECRGSRGRRVPGRQGRSAGLGAPGSVPDRHPQRQHRRWAPTC